MPQVDFYILTGRNDDARLDTACRIADKATRQGQRVFVNMSSQAEARKLDELLWTFSQNSFIPHCIAETTAGPEPEEPVLIGYSQPPASTHREVLINLAATVPQFAADCRRVVEIVDDDPARRDQGRERYRIYRERGFELIVHRM